MRLEDLHRGEHPGGFGQNKEARVFGLDSGWQSMTCPGPGPSNDPRECALEHAAKPLALR